MNPTMRLRETPPDQRSRAIDEYEKRLLIPKRLQKSYVAKKAGEKKAKPRSILNDSLVRTSKAAAPSPYKSKAEREMRGGSKSMEHEEKNNNARERSRLPALSPSRSPNRSIKPESEGASAYCGLSFEEWKQQKMAAKAQNQSEKEREIASPTEQEQQSEMYSRDRTYEQWKKDKRREMKRRRRKELEEQRAKEEAKEQEMQERLRKINLQKEQTENRIRKRKARLKAQRLGKPRKVSPQRVREQQPEEKSSLQVSGPKSPYRNKKGPRRGVNKKTLKPLQRTTKPTEPQEEGAATSQKKANPTRKKIPTAQHVSRCGHEDKPLQPSLEVEGTRSTYIVKDNAKQSLAGEETASNQEKPSRTKTGASESTMSVKSSSSVDNQVLDDEQSYESEDFDDGEYSHSDVFGSGDMGGIPIVSTEGCFDFIDIGSSDVDEETRASARTSNSEIVLAPKTSPRPEAGEHSPEKDPVSEPHLAKEKPMHLEICRTTDSTSSTESNYPGCSYSRASGASSVDSMGLTYRERSFTPCIAAFDIVTDEGCLDFIFGSSEKEESRKELQASDDELESHTCSDHEIEDQEEEEESQGVITPLSPTHSPMAVMADEGSSDNEQDRVKSNSPNAEASDVQNGSFVEQDTNRGTASQFTRGYESDDFGDAARTESTEVSAVTVKEQVMPRTSEVQQHVPTDEEADGYDSDDFE